MVMAQVTFDTVQRNLATLWNMPEIVLERSPPPVYTEYSDIQLRIHVLELREEVDGDGVLDNGRIAVTRSHGSGDWMDCILIFDNIPFLIVLLE